MKRRLSLFGVLLVFALGAAGPAGAQPRPISEAARQQIKALQDEKASRTPAQLKLDSQLIYGLRQQRHQPMAAGVSQLRTSVEFQKDGLVLVDIDSKVTPALLQSILQAGGKVIYSSERFHSIRAALPLDQMETAAQSPDVKAIKLAVKRMVYTGSVDSEGDVTHRAIDARPAFGVNGLGVNVGVMSDSVDLLAQAQSTGDLPPNVTVLPGQSGIAPGSTGEGTAMMEIVYDLAPGANLFFATADPSEAAFAQNILNLRAAGCDIIVDDVGYFDESPFQDNIIAQAINQVTADGALYFSSAANGGNKDKNTSSVWEGDFANGGAVATPVDGKGGFIHSFGGTTNFNTVTALGYTVVLFWSDPLGASTNDYDLFILDSTGASVIASSTTVQNGAQDPYESAVPDKVNEQVVVVLAKGDPRFLHVENIRNNSPATAALSINTAGLTHGHNCASNAFDVAAVDVHDSYPSAFTGGAVDPVETFSADGPRHMFYDQNGVSYTGTNLLSTGGITRQKPDIAAADGGSSSLAHFNPFYGTSAAAPHAAAVAALLKSYSPKLTPQEMRLILTNSALDIEGPGLDRDSGAGIVMAFQALAAAPPPAPVPRLEVQGFTVTGGNGNGMIDQNECNLLDVTVTNLGNATATAVQCLLSSSTPQVFIVQGTASYPNLDPGAASAGRTPFRVSTTPSFVCGTPITFQLTIKYGQGVARTEFTVQTGMPGTPIRFNNGTALAIPDYPNAGVLSPITVSGFTGPLSKVTVSLHATHPRDEDLELILIAPDGNEVLLAAVDGGLGQNYGTSCNTDATRTTFDDDASISINSGSAPLVGSYQPYTPLSVLSGMTPDVVNGTWYLYASDIISGDAGALQCWSLNLTPVVCADGGGECPGSDLGVTISGAPEPVVVGYPLTYTLVMSNAGPSTAKGVVLSQTLPASSQFVSASVSQGNYTASATAVSFGLGNVLPGTAVYAYVTVIPTAAGPLSSTASVGFPGTELNPANNTATAINHAIQPTSDLGVTIAGTPNPVLAGANLTYQISVTNNGPNPAPAVTVTTTLPANVNFVSANSTKGTLVSQGNAIVASLGTLPLQIPVVITIVVSPQVVGSITATAQVASGNGDQLPANNVATAVTVVGAAADIAVSANAASQLITGLNYTNVITVTNRGPNNATGVVLNDALPAGTLVSSNLSKGTMSFSHGTIVCNIGALTNGASAKLTLVMTAPSFSTNLTSTLSASASQADPYLTNNSLVILAQVAPPTVTIVGAGSTLTSEGFSPPDGAIDLGETVTIQFGLKNVGNTPSTSLTATLLATNGVTAPSGSQSYGTLLPGGLSLAQPFSFTATGALGGALTATFQLQNNGTNLGLVTFPFALPGLAVFSNAAPITIPDSGAGSPYPSTIRIAGISNLVTKAAVTLNGFTHSYPHDVSVLVTNPAGIASMVLSHAGAAGLASPVTNLTLTFDRTAPAPASASSQLFSGTFQPTYYPTVAMPAPAPAGPYSTNLIAFEGVNPNGTWSLFVYDDSVGDAGNIANGWSVVLTTVSPVNKVADVGIAVSSSASSAQVGDTVTYTLTIGNAGPAAAGTVIVTNVLPSFVNYASSVLPSGATVISTGPTSIFNLGTLAAGSNAVVTISAVAVAAGNGSDLASAGSTEVDLNVVNNSASAPLGVSVPVADLGLSVLASTNTLVVGSNLVFTVNLTNSGPNAALNVVVTDALPAGLVFVSANTLQGAAGTNAGGVLVWNAGNLTNGASAALSLTAQALTVGQQTNVLTAASVSTDPNSANNSASVVTSVTYPMPIIVAQGDLLISEGFSPPNGAVNPGEQVVVSFTLANVGVASTTNLTAHLLATGGVAPVTTNQIYGAINPGGSAARSYTFVGNGSPGGTITATLALSDNGNPLGSVAFSFAIPGPTNFVNTAQIIIPDQGPAQPDPSSISVSNLVGLVSKVTVTINGLTHGYSHDIAMALVAPSGQTVPLMVAAGGAHSLTNLTLTFDDSAPQGLPIAGVMASGSYRPTSFNPGESFFSLTGTAGSPSLASFNAVSPNGVWSLFVQDDAPGDSGVIANGWSLTITPVSTVNPASDLAIGMTGSPTTVLGNDFVTYSMNVTNFGPASASNVVISTLLPTNTTLVSISTPQGTANTNVAGSVLFQLGTLAPGGVVTATVTVQTSRAGAIACSASVASDGIDLVAANNYAFITTTVSAANPFSLAASFAGTTLHLTLSGQTGEIYAIQYSTDLTTWHSVSTNTPSAGGSFDYLDVNPSDHQRFYRAVRLPH